MTASLQYSHMFRWPTDRKDFHPTQRVDPILVVEDEPKQNIKYAFMKRGGCLAYCMMHNNGVKLAGDLSSKVK